MDGYPTIKIKKRESLGVKKSTQGKEFRTRRSKRNDGERQENGKASILKEG